MPPPSWYSSLPLAPGARVRSFSRLHCRMAWYAWSQRCPASGRFTVSRCTRQRRLIVSSVPSDPGRRICPSIGGPVSPAACQVWATARVAEREPHMTAHAELVICEQSIERTFSWIDQNQDTRRMSKDYERLCASGEALVYAAMIRLMTRRLTRL